MKGGTDVFNVIVVTAEERAADLEQPGLGNNTLTHLDHGRQLADRLVTSGEQIGFAFGSGITDEYEPERTIGQQMAAWMYELYPNEPILERCAQQEQFEGVLTEVVWSLDAWSEAKPDGELCFHVVADRWQMWQVRLLRLVRYPLVPMEYEVVTWH